MRRLVVGLLVLLSPGAAGAQVIDQIRWVPNGPVYALARHDGTTYVGGQFTIISPPSGAGAPINTGNDVIPAGFPQVAGQVFSVIADGSDGWIIGGSFTSVGDQPRNNIARINSDRTVSSWNPNADGPVRALVLSQLGTVYAGGDFATMGGLARSRLAEVDLTSGMTIAMVVGVNATVRALAYMNGNIYVGGDFTTANGNVRNRGCSVTASTRALNAWNPNVNGPVYALEGSTRVSPTITVLVGGSFSTLGGQPRSNLAETSYLTGAPSVWNPSPNGPVRDILEQAVDYIAGDFTTVGGQPRNHAASLTASGSLTSWDPNVDGSVAAIAWTNNSVYLGGTFENVGGLPRRNAAKVDEAAGVPAVWNPMPNNTVTALAPGGGGKMYAGGTFTGFGGVARRNAAAFDDWTGLPTAWNPDVDNTVRAIALQVFEPVLYRVYLGGDFLNVGGQPRAHMAAVRYDSGVPEAWTANANQAVRTILAGDAIVVFGGDFVSVDGEATSHLAGKLHTGGPVVHFDGLAGNDTVFALSLNYAPNLTQLHVGGVFGLARFNLTTHNLIDYQNPATNGAVRALLSHFSTEVYVGGDFTNVGGQPHSHLAKLTGNVNVEATWNAGTDGVVRALAHDGPELIVVGEFLNAGGKPRARIAQIDEWQATTSSLWGADIRDGAVWAVSVHGPVVDVGGTFHGFAVGATVAAGYGVLGLDRSLVTCMGPPFATVAGSRPRALAVLDADADGVPDIALCDGGGATKVLTVMRGLGNGSFSLLQSITVSGTPRSVRAADFDKDGRPDLAVCESDDTAQIEILHNLGGTFQSWTAVPLMGRSEGIEAGDFNADGIVDLVACLLDSASVIRHGGLEFFRGGGMNGTWDGTFAFASKSSTHDRASARRVIAQDLDNDGYPDFLFTGTFTRPALVHTDANLQVDCSPILRSDFWVTTPGGFAMATGDFDEDGQTDIAYEFDRVLSILTRTPGVGCNISFGESKAWVELPSTPSDLAAIDVDQDGILDVLCAFDSVGTLAVCRGGGTGGVPDGTLLPAVTLAVHDVYAIGLGDFVSDGTTDVVTSMATCGQVGVWQNTSSPQFPMMVRLDSPNGGESLSGTPPVAGTDAAPPASVASLRSIAWTKGAGVHGVDVELSRNDGGTWESIATNMPGTSMTWYSTPPAATLARVRVRDAAYRGHMDASDAPFAIITGLIGTPPPGAPLQAGLALLGRNPSLGAMRFRLDVPQAADVAIVVYDAAGRAVRTLARRAYAAGTYDMGWDGVDDRGASARRGVYFVKTTIGPFRATRKVVML